MELFKIKQLLRTVTPIVQAQRNRGKINIQRPRAPHFLRQLEIDLTKPILPKKVIDPIQKCVSERTKTVEKSQNPYLRIIGKDCRNWFDQSKLVAIFHVNPISQEDMFKLQVALHQHQMYVKRYGRETLEIAFENTGYKALMPLFQSQTLIVFCAEPQVTKLMKAVKKTPQVILLGGIVEGRLLHKDDLVKYGKLPDLQMARATLAGVLNMAGMSITSQLNQHQCNLMRLLDSRKDQLSEKKDGNE